MEKLQISGRTQKSRPTRADCCPESDCASGVRNNYFLGKRLTPDGFQVEQSYHNKRRHLLNRAVFGWGVVYGFSIEAAPPRPYERQTASGRLQIGPGLALDECGRELVQTETIEIELDDVIPLEKTKFGADAGEHCWLLSAHYVERDIDPMPVSDPCRCDRQAWDRVCETVRYSLRQIDCTQCCSGHECELQCDCAGSCCADGNADESTACNPVARGGARCLCEHLTKLDPDPDCDGLCEVQQSCGRVRVDLRHGVPLACVRLSRGPCTDWAFDNRIDACGPRRLVKRNDVLFDLIRGCDLTRICKIGWAQWHRSISAIPWSDFVGSFGQESGDENVTRDYWVEFSRPVHKNTVRTDCFSMTIFVQDHEEGWCQAWRVPIVRVDTSGEPNTPTGFVTKATLVVDAGWVDDALRSRKTLFDGHEGWVEIEVLGDYIIDCSGQTVDANAVGLSRGPTGNGSPGGVFISRFRVEARERYAQRPYEPEQRTQGVQP